MKTKKERAGEMGRANEALYHGPRARYFYFECLQLILRMQIKVLMQEWNLPAEFETVCRDIWALHLSMLPRPPQAEPYLHAKERGDEDDDAEEKVDDGKANSPSSSDTESDEDDAIKPDETLLADLLKEASESESSEEEGKPQEGNPPRKETTKSAGKPRNRYEVPAGNIAVLMMACWTMRFPVMYKDFIRYVGWDNDYSRWPLNTSYTQTDRRIQASLPGTCPVVALGHEAASGTRNHQYAESART